MPYRPKHNDKNFKSPLGRYEGKTKKSHTKLFLGLIFAMIIIFGLSVVYLVKTVSFDSKTSNIFSEMFKKKVEPSSPVKPSPYPSKEPVYTPKPSHHVVKKSVASFEGRAGEKIYEIPVKKKDKVVALTFDDGPSPWTKDIVKILEEEQVKATFFTLGEEVKQYPEVVKILKDKGMSVQSHGNNHINMALSSKEKISRDLDKSIDELSHEGITPKCVRPPYGATDKSSSQVFVNYGYPQVLWNVDSLDWTLPGTKKIRNKVMREVKPGSIILMHDGGGNRKQTVDSLKATIRELKKDKYKFTVLCQD